MEAAGKRYIVHPSRNDVITIWGIGDIHLGNPGCDLKSVKRDIQAIKDDPYSFWIGLGDYADYISPRDKRFNGEALTEEARINIHRLGKYYAEEVYLLFADIAPKCLGLLYGNHEEKYMVEKEQSDLHAWLCSELEVPNLRYSAIFDIAFARTKCDAPKLVKKLDTDKTAHSEIFRTYCHHGAGGATTPGGKLNSLIRFMQMVDADLYFMGHVHDQKGQRLIQLGANWDCNKLAEKHKIGTICGGYLKTYTPGVTGYGEVKGYMPTSLGPSKVRIKPASREVSAEI